jgi:hypothetical protein
MSGEGVFNAIGCNKCHIAEWTTPNDKSLEEAIRGKVIRPYSDFLLHDMGLLGDGVQEGDANESEMRTPTLWNLRTRDPMLHDGRAAGGTFASRVEAAILAHGPFGEGAASAAAYEALPALQKVQLVAFLDSLGRVEFDYSGDQNGDVDAQDAARFVEAFVRDGGTPPGDCDGDGVNDLVAIFNGAPDENADGIPDDCGACVGDLTGDGFVNGADLATLLSAWGSAAGDLTGDGTTNGADLATLLSAWGPC